MELLWRARRRKALIYWPEAVDARLELLVRAATAAGESVSRSQVLAALVAGADTSPEGMAAAVRRYRLLPAEALAETGTELPQVRHPGPARTR